MPITSKFGCIICQNDNARIFSAAEVDLNRFVIVRGAHEYRTADYKTATNRVDLRISMAVGSVKIL